MMWRHTDMFPGEWEIGSEFSKELNIGDQAKVILDSQFRDKDQPRRIGQVGIVVEIDSGDEWAYKLKFKDGDNWFKRYHLQKVDNIKEMY